MSDAAAERRRAWGAAARGWKKHARTMGEATMPVSAWLVDAIAPQPGQVVLELAAGTGEVGLLAAELIEPGGTLICTDFAPEMLTVAQERAAELGLSNVRFKQVDAQSIDLEAASVDSVICRFGYMLMPDPEAALRETRRVLRPGGRVALAVWAAPEANPWMYLIARELLRRGAIEPPAPDEPGPFKWAEEGIVEEMLAGAGFVEDVVVEPLDFQMGRPSFDDWWSATLEVSTRTRDAVASMDPGEVDEVREAIRAAAEPYAQPDGSLPLPARAWVARATA